jgi:hypothetical protein
MPALDPLPTWVIGPMAAAPPGPSDPEGTAAGSEVSTCTI